MKTDRVYEIVETKTDKRKELEFWAALLIKELNKINKILDEVYIKCQTDLDKEKENEIKL